MLHVFTRIKKKTGKNKMAISPKYGISSCLSLQSPFTCQVVYWRERRLQIAEFVPSPSIIEIIYPLQPQKLESLRTQKSQGSRFQVNIRKCLFLNKVSSNKMAFWTLTFFFFFWRMLQFSFPTENFFFFNVNYILLLIGGKLLYNIVMVSNTFESVLMRWMNLECMNCLLIL